MDNQSVDILCIQEHHRPGKNAIFEDTSLNDYLYLLHGNEKKTGPGRNDCGVRFVLSPSARTAWKNAHELPHPNLPNL